MKTLELLRGLYAELKRFNDNVERLTQYNAKKEAEKLNPLIGMTGTELLGLKYWIKDRLHARGIKVETYDWGHFYHAKEVEKFLNARSKIFCNIAVKEALSAALWYDNFSSLVADWRRGAKVGAA